MTSHSPIRLRVLGPLDARVGGQSVPLGGPRQRAVLALLVASRGDVVSVDRMIEDLWRGEPPAKATASLQSYVANLRRVLEPGRALRAPARVIVSAAPGYAIRMDADAVDAWRFERLADAARALAETDPARARQELGEALGLWRGTAFAEVADEEWAVAESARLAEIRLGAQELLVAVTLRSAPATEAVPGAELLTRRHPLREESWRLLALALWGSGRQADALTALRRARTMLSDELGLDPGPELVALERAILNQDLTPLRAATRQPAERQPVPPPGPIVPADPGTPRPAPVRAAEQLFFGRDAELAALRRTAVEVAAGESRIVLISGEPGAGKSTLLGHLMADLDPAVWRVACGRCPEEDGAPPAWAWVETLRRLAAQVPLGQYEQALAPLLSEGQIPHQDDAATGRFRLHRAVCSWLREMTGDGPADGRALAVVLDDLHRGDAETLGLLTTVAEELATSRILLVAAYRPSEVSQAQSDSLAQLATRSPVRLPLAGLSAADVKLLVTAVCDRPVDPDMLDSLAERTGGNPFYVRESARLLASEGQIGAVPDGVRDVLRRRLARLPAPAVSVLRLAAVVGREAEVEVLIGAADTDEDGVLDALEAGVLTGLLTEPSPGRVRFTHALVRDTLYQDLSGLRRSRTHARVADIVERLRPTDLPALAHHYARAATSGTAERAMEYSIRAAELATRRYAHDTAAGLLTQALECFDRVPGDIGDRAARRVDLLARLVGAQVLAAAVTAARDTRQRAIDVAEETGRDDLLLKAFTCWTEATPWQIKPYAVVDERALGLLARLLRRTDLDPLTRCRLLEMTASELDGEDDPRAEAIVAELAAIAATADDPAIHALNLTVRIRQYHAHEDPRLLVELADELARLGAEHDMVAYRWYGQFVGARACYTKGDIPGMRTRLDRALDLAKAYQMVEARQVGLVAEAMLAHVHGRLAESERLYNEAYGVLRRAGSITALGAQTFSIFAIRLSQHREAEYLPIVERMFEEHGPLVADFAALCMLDAGLEDRAREMRRRRVPLRRDFYHVVYATLRGMAVARIGEPGEAAEMIALLTPMRDELPGSVPMSVAARPVAHVLGDLYRSQGRPAEAEREYRHAVTVARRYDAPLWEADAEAAARDVVSKSMPRGRQEV
ncbi:BTAD domain-containing putative transcriptional regulator [Acrocarpospora catenulata]|uniref:BTAD domain-containing putative transcriptional regulator n=1 Tax=Acrocarpospora catenulata TaxID=2836182 RepID=UPI001BD9796F|nr:BTAD domain-containing putative transcriptional regulator [Acrocarpospora catenulata]